MKRTLVDGQASDQIACDDRSFAYGDGVFETVAVEAGHVDLWTLHLARLQKGCGALGLAYKDFARIEAEVFDLATEISDGVIKIVVSAGSGIRGYRRSQAQPSRVIIAETLDLQPLQQKRAEGVTATICQTRLNPQPQALVGVKHTARIEQVLARAEWDDEWDEGIMLDAQDYLCEGTMSNLFVLDQAGNLFTPSLRHCGVHGVMREWLLQQSEGLGIRVLQGNMPADVLSQSCGMFFCNSVIQAWPVKQLGDQPFDLSPIREILNCFRFSDRQ